jgi:hypothetical protein
MSLFLLTVCVRVSVCVRACVCVRVCVCVCVLNGSDAAFKACRANSAQLSQLFHHITKQGSKGLVCFHPHHER